MKKPQREAASFFSSPPTIHSSSIWRMGVLGAFLFLLSCGGEVMVSVPGCEDCKDRCLQTKEGRGRCVNCLKDEQCQSPTSPTRKCIANRCYCGSDKDCPEGKYCDGQKGCVECMKDEHCTDKKAPVCLYRTCVECNPKAVRACSPEGTTPCAKGEQTCQVNGSWTKCENYLVCKENERCIQGKCLDACPEPPPCKEGEKLCTTASDVYPGRYKECKLNEVSCWDFAKEEKHCGTREVCEKGVCNPYTCPTPECQPGQSKCVGEDKARVCERNAKGCLVWGEAQDCAKDKKCRPTLGKCTFCDPKSTQSCYTASDPATKGIGICKAGEQVCKEDGSAFGDCQNQVLPQTEICDDQDNDCDGTTDEDFPTKGDECEVGVGACKSKGKLVCKANGLGVECDAQSGNANKEECNGKDDDCDGSIDNVKGKTEAISQACYTGDAATKGVGLCQEGTQECKNGSWDTCQKEVLPQTETCDGKDNDCDGQTDEDFATLSQTCTVGKGECEQTGKFICKKDGSGVECDATPGQPATEVCDNKDNNCDGKIDEGLKQSCFSGSSGCTKLAHSYSCKGLCQAGTQTCSAGQWGTCTGEVTPQTETCDGKDNDCDGAIDNGLPTKAYYPDTDQDGFGDKTAAPVVACKALAPSGHVTNNTDCNDKDNKIKPGISDVCDGIDNNCNGSVDEDGSSITWYYDGDKDGYGIKSNTISGCRKDTKTICTGLKTCRSSEGWASRSGDCCDSDSLAHPGQTKYFGSANRCNSYDYNCDGSSTPQYSPCLCSRSVRYFYEGTTDTYRQDEGWRRWYTRSRVTTSYSNNTCEMRHTISLQAASNTTRSSKCSWCSSKVWPVCTVTKTCTVTHTFYASKTRRSWTPRASGGAYYVMWLKSRYKTGCAYRIDGRSASCGDTVYRTTGLERFSYSRRLSESGFDKGTMACSGNHCAKSYDARLNYLFGYDSNYVFTRRSTASFRLGCR